MNAMWADAWALGWWSLVLFVLLCWWLGAFRRFKRLRNQVRSAFEPVDEQLQNAVRWLQGLPAQAQVPLAAQAAFQALQPTADLLTAALVQARANPMSAPALAQLDGIWQSLQAAWLAYAHTAASAVQDLDSPTGTVSAAPATALLPALETASAGNSHSHSHSDSHSNSADAPQEGSAAGALVPLAASVSAPVAPGSTVLDGAPGAAAWLTQANMAWSEQNAVLLHRMQQFNHAVQAYNYALQLPPGSAWAKVQGLQPARSFALPQAAQ